MNILLVSYYFYPELTPRAFRTFELVKEFCEQGHKVTLLIPNKICYDTEKYQHNNLTVCTIGEKLHGIQLLENQSPLEDYSESSLPKKQFYKKIIPHFFKNKLKVYLEWYNSSFRVIRHKPFIKAIVTYLKINNSVNYDFILSIGLPIESHIGTAISLLKFKNLKKSAIAIADYGDPFSKQQHVFWWYSLVDYFIAKMFDYISVPTQKAKESFTTFKNENRIKIIPQAFNLSEYRLAEYKPNQVPTFAYAGCFYLKIRNPKDFFNYLNKTYTNYHFILYTINENTDTLEILKSFKDTFKDKLTIKYNVGRIPLIYELSKMDFLINFENTSNNQTPSKLIDYAISGRPICSISTANFKSNIFDEFMTGNFENETIINLPDYDIKKVVKQYLSIESSNENK
jgi:hypothetical protein